MHRIHGKVINREYRDSQSFLDRGERNHRRKFTAQLSNIQRADSAGSPAAPSLAQPHRAPGWNTLYLQLFMVLSFIDIGLHLKETLAAQPPNPSTQQYPRPFNLLRSHEPGSEERPPRSQRPPLVFFDYHHASGNSASRWNWPRVAAGNYCSSVPVLIEKRRLNVKGQEKVVSRVSADSVVRVAQAKSIFKETCREIKEFPVH
jgi:hypothetical protein